MLADAASYATLPLMHRMLQTYCTPRKDFVDTFFLLNQVDSARQLSKDVLRVLREQTGSHFVGTIHADATVPEALAVGVDVLDHGPDSQASHDVLACAAAVAEQMGALIAHVPADSAVAHATRN